jgi:hypothetical protein
VRRKLCYEVTAEGRPLGVFASSNADYKGLVRAAGDYPGLQQLFATGTSSDIQAVSAELRQIESPPGAKKTAKSLAAKICGQKCIEISHCSPNWPAVTVEVKRTAKWAVTMTKVRIRQALSRTRW